MSEALHRNLIHRIRHTPMRDLLRGRLTGRLDFKRQIEAAELPSEAKALLLRVVCRTRVWSLERLEITDDLISHFSDGLKAGTSERELIGKFGDERAAARLVARAKRRNRSIAMRAISGLRWLSLALFLYYVGLATYFYAGRPTPTVNYLQLLNRQAEEIPQDQRAWTVYMRAALETMIIERDQELTVQREIQEAKPGDPLWPQKADWLRSRSDLIDRVRQATKKPSLGVVLGPKSGWMIGPALQPSAESLDFSYGADWLGAVQVGYLNGARFIIAELLADDAKLAREDNDGPRSMRDIEALINFARQLCKSNFINSDLVSLAIRSDALQEIQLTLAESGDLIADADLQDLAHRLAIPDTDDELIGLNGERMFFYDTVQHIYTNDGHGDGRITEEGMLLLRNVDFSWRHTLQPTIRALVSPRSLIAARSRRELLKEYDQWMDSAEAQLRQPLRNANWTPLTEQKHRWISSMGLSSLGDRPLALFVPAVEGAQAVAEQYLGRRDGILIGIALELYKRQHGNFPASLQPLAPTLLPSIPIDRITGAPLHYRLIDGHPLIYSVGVDRDDDGGRFPLTPGGNPDPLSAAKWDIAPEKAVNGDWVLYPQPPSPD